MGEHKIIGLEVRNLATPLLAQTVLFSWTSIPKPFVVNF